MVARLHAAKGKLIQKRKGQLKQIIVIFGEIGNRFSNKFIIKKKKSTLLEASSLMR
jgi:hypothetical protein